MIEPDVLHMTFSAQLMLYALLGVVLLVAVWYAARKMAFWNTLRKWDRRQRVSPRVAVLTWTVTILGFVPLLVHGLDTTWTSALFGVGFLLGTNVLGVYVSNLDWYRAHSNTPRTDARLVGSEPVVVSGTVVVPDNEPDVEPIEAPISQEPCVAYLASIDERRWAYNTGRGTSRTTATLALDDDATPFYVEDETGRVLVDPTDADVLLSTPLEAGLGADHATRITVDGGHDPPDHLSAYAESLGVSPRRRRKQTYHELRIEAGDEVYVIGEGNRVSGTDAPARATRVVSSGDGANVNVVVQEPYDVVDDAFDKFRPYYLYGGAIATSVGYVGLALLTLW